MAKYFVQGDRIHKYPYALCGAVRTYQRLFDELADVPKGYLKCDVCFDLKR